MNFIKTILILRRTIRRLRKEMATIQEQLNALSTKIARSETNMDHIDFFVNAPAGYYTSLTYGTYGPVQIPNIQQIIAELTLTIEGYGFDALYTQKETALNELIADKTADIIAGGSLSGSQGLCGLFPKEFGKSKTGAPETIKSLDSYVENSEFGRVQELVGDDFIAPRNVFPIDGDQVWKLTGIYKRIRNSGDPSGDAIQYAVEWLDNTFGSVGETTIEQTLNLTAGGVVTANGFVSNLPFQGVLNPPSGAVYFRPYIQNYGSTSKSIAVMNRVDMVDPDFNIEGTTVSQALANAQAAVTAANSAIALIDPQNFVNSTIYESYTEAEQSTPPVDATILTIKTNNGMLQYKKDVNGTALTTDDGAKWSLITEIVRNPTRQKQIAGIGSSQIARTHYKSDVADGNGGDDPRYQSSQAMMTWAALYSKGGIVFPYDLNFAQGGAMTNLVRSTQAPALIDAYLAGARIDEVVCYASGNDVANGRAYADIIADIDLICGMITGNGLPLTWISLFPRGGVTATQQLFDRVNKYIIDLPNKFAGVKIVQGFYQLLADDSGLSDSGTDFINHKYLDGTHLAPIGASIVGREIAKVISPNFNGMASNGQALYNATANPKGFIISPIFRGATAYSGTESGITGNIPTGWSITRVGAFSTIASSVEEVAIDGQPVKAWKLATAVSASLGGGYASFKHNDIAVTSDMIGKTLNSEMTIFVKAGAKLSLLELEMRVDTSASVASISIGNSRVGASPNFYVFPTPLVDTLITIRTPSKLLETGDALIKPLLRSKGQVASAADFYIVNYKLWLE